MKPQMSYRIGRHVTGAAQVLTGLRQTALEGGTAAQVFAGNPMGYASGLLPEHKIREIRDMTRHIYTVVHGSYFLLLTQPEDTERARLAVDGTVQQLWWAERIGAKSVVVHPGSTTNPNWGVAAHWYLERVLEQYRGPVTLLLETMAGRTSLGNDVDQLKLIASVYDSARVGICLDTTHSWAAGYSIPDLCTFPERLGAYLQLVHFNVPNAGITQGCHQDRHNVDFGNSEWSPIEIARLSHALKHLPCILEGTPNPRTDYEFMRGNAVIYHSKAQEAGA